MADSMRSSDSIVVKEVGPGAYALEKQPREVPDHVNKPPHYTSGGIETIDFIEAKRLNYNRGNCVKYLSRAGKKDPAKELEDLLKAQFYLNREIAHLQGKTGQ